MSATMEGEVSLEDARELLVDLVSTSPSGEEREAAQRLVDFSRPTTARSGSTPSETSARRQTTRSCSPHTSTPSRVRFPSRSRTGDDEILWGRGSVDATGPLVAMAAAAVRTGVSFVGVVGEEIDSRGSRYLVDDRDTAPAAVVNGEPSGADGITLGYRGLIAGTYVATSESGHTSRPDPNAIQHAVSWWSAVEDHFEAGEYEPVFEQVTTKPVDIEGGISEDGLSVETTMAVQLRVPPTLDVETVREAAEAELEVGTVTWKDKVPPVMMSPRTEVARAFASRSERLATIRAWSERPAPAT